MNKKIKNTEQEKTMKSITINISIKCKLTLKILWSVNC